VCGGVVVAKFEEGTIFARNEEEKRTTEDGQIVLTTAQKRQQSYATKRTTYVPTARTNYLPVATLHCHSIPHFPTQSHPSCSKHRQHQNLYQPTIPVVQRVLLEHHP
jgi:hypothetical protein